MRAATERATDPGSGTDGQAGRDRPGPRSYAGVPLVHKAHWKWLVIAYFFLGGIAGGAQVIAAVSSRFGGRRAAATTRAARYVSLFAFLPCPPLLILDLGRPERFLHMLRVLKLRSPMSVGTWVLVAFGPLAALLGARQAAEDGVLPGRLRSAAYWLGNGRIQTPAGVLGIALAGYTGVLLGATAVPLWTRRATLLGPLFLCSAMSSAAAAVALVRSRIGTGHDPRLAAFEQGASLAESAALLAWMAALGKTGAPLRDGRRGSALRHGVGGIGLALPLLLNAAGQATSRRRPLATGAALLTLLGGFLLRYLVVVGGHASADDPEATFEITRRRTADPS